ncbi:MAG: phosphatase PAP2 family protein [Bacteroidales bacterium]|nr:phosphatase PAP2 family protein [Bacteroidales bacterium]MBR6775793.1 phosphatase PAP2 family protein [Bacteroidales bacterium]
MKKIFLILFLLTVVCNQQSSAQSSELKVQGSECEILLSKSYLKSYWHSGLTVLGQPLHYDWKDWTVFGGIATATTLAFVYDDEIFNYIDKTFTNSQSNTISQYSDIYGEELFIVPSIALTYGIGAIAKDTRLKNMSLATLQSFIFAEVASAGIKVLTCRERPDANSQQPTANSQSWLGPFATFESTSFVSGHSTRAFALATTVAGFYPEKKWIGIVSYSLATMTAVGRVISKEHWTSDVIVGAALGYFIGRGVVKFNEKIGNINSVRIEPIATNYGVGIAVKF